MHNELEYVPIFFLIKCYVSIQLPFIHIYFNLGGEQLSLSIKHRCTVGQCCMSESHDDLFSRHQTVMRMLGVG